MRVAFDPGFDAGAWPGARGFGVAWVGPGGLLRILETALGLGGPLLVESERAAALVPTLRASEGFWSSSVAVDPLGSARRLLLWREMLVEAGWQGEGVSDRLQHLARITSVAPPGPADRLREVVSTLQRRRADIEEISLIEPRETLSLLWRNALQALEERGTRITRQHLEPATAAGDLAMARQHDLAPRGDGTLQLLRPHAPLAAAEITAAWLAAQEPGEVVVISGDEVLDAALHRFGVPTLGSGRSPQDSALGQLVALTLAIGYSPPDPQRVLELLQLPIGPVPKRIAGRLADALSEAPAVGSPIWEEALTDALDAEEDPQRRARVKDRLDVLFAPSVLQGQPYPVTEVRRRLAMLASWLRARSAADEELADALGAPQVQIAALERLLDATAIEQLSPPELVRFVRESVGALPVTPGFDAKAGTAAVGSPEGMAGPADLVVWWRFTRASAPTVPRQPWSAQERAELGAARVVLPDSGADAIALSRRWRRPLDQTTRTLLFVCPERDAAGEEETPHPLWDEITANLTAGASAASLVVGSPMSAQTIRTSVRDLRALPQPTHDFSVPAGSIRPREEESPSGAGSLLGCPFQWVMNYAAKLRGGRAASLPTGSALTGTLAHEILAQLLQDPGATPEQAGALFERLGPQLAAELFLPGAERERANAERMVIESASALIEMIRQRKMIVKGVEQSYVRRALGTKLRGRLDLVLDHPLCVVDLKLRGSTRFREALQQGTAHQLALYSYLAGGRKADMPPVAYFVLEDQRLISTDRRAFPDADHVDGPGPLETLKATERAYASAIARLADGKVTALGVGEDVPESAIVEGELVLEPGCRWCDYDALCGLSFMEAP